MTDATLQLFRNIADDMGLGKNTDYAIVIDRTVGDRSYAEVKVFGLTLDKATTGAGAYKNGRVALTSEVLVSRRAR